MNPLMQRPEILLCPNIPKPLHGVNPRTILGPQWWEKTRQEAFCSLDYHCAACGIHKSKAEEHQWLEGHELYEIDYPAGRMTYRETVGLCHYCHHFVHNGRMVAMVVAGEISAMKWRAILDHGNAVLASVGLERLPPCTGPMPDWADWRLVLDGVEYPPIHVDFAAWKAAYHVGEPR